MRSSKKRSRSTQSRPRSIGNIINRVFDSSGPDGKVRGTPQQIIEKYLSFARDAQLSNDRVAAENFLQHAEHYTRLLAEAQREIAAEQEARQQQIDNSRDRGESHHRDERAEPSADNDRDSLPGGEVIDLDGGDESSLVDLPESRPRRIVETKDMQPGESLQPSARSATGSRRERSAAPKRSAPSSDKQADDIPELPAFISASPDMKSAEAEDAGPAEAKIRRPRAPRKPKIENAPEIVASPAEE